MPFLAPQASLYLIFSLPSAVECSEFLTKLMYQGGSTVPLLETSAWRIHEVLADHRTARHKGQFRCIVACLF